MDSTEPPFHIANALLGIEEYSITQKPEDLGEQVHDVDDASSSKFLAPGVKATPDENQYRPRSVPSSPRKLNSI